MREFGLFYKIEIVHFHGVARTLKIRELLLEAVARKNDMSWPLQGEESTPCTAQVRQADAIRMEWEAKSEAVLDIIMLLVNGAAERRY